LTIVAGAPDVCLGLVADLFGSFEHFVRALVATGFLSYLRDVCSIANEFCFACFGAMSLSFELAYAVLSE
jgi:hypothetical protein